MEQPNSPLYLTALTVIVYILLYLWLVIQNFLNGRLMAKFGSKSKQKLATSDKKLQKVFNEVIKYVDCSVLEGHRDERRQERLFSEGKTKVHYPMGRHNTKPSRAVDVTPYPVDWVDRERQTLFAGMVIGLAIRMGFNIRWGGDWNRNFKVNDNKFDDFPHFELVD